MAGVSLLDQELRTINQLLQDIQERERTYTLCFVGLLLGISLVGLILLLDQLTALDFDIPNDRIVSLAILFMLIFSTGCWALWRHKRSFTEMKHRCLRLHRAGLILYKQRAFLRDEIAAAEVAPSNAEFVLDVEALTPYVLHHRFS